jgi:hypothetical protein
MTTEQEIAKNQEERNEARQDLRNTLTEVNAKLERAESGLRPTHLIESHPVGACLVAGALGLLLGSRINGRVTGPTLIAALLGVALSRRSPYKGSERDGRETSTDD